MNERKEARKTSRKKRKQLREQIWVRAYEKLQGRALKDPTYRMPGRS